MTASSRVIVATATRITSNPLGGLFRFVRRLITSWRDASILSQFSDIELRDARISKPEAEELIRFPFKASR
jgi:hypothetical protein